MSHLRKNPPFYPSVELVNDIFYIILHALKEYVDSCRALPKNKMITREYIDQTASLVSNFYHTVKSRYNPAFKMGLDTSIKNILTLTKKLEKQNENIYKLLDNTLSAHACKSAALVEISTLQRDIEQLKNIIKADKISAERILERSELMFDQSKIVEKLLKVFSPHFDAYLSHRYEGSIDQYLDEDTISIPEGWGKVPDVPGSICPVFKTLDKIYYISKGTKFNLPLPLYVNVSQVSKDLDGSCSYSEHSFSLNFYTLPDFPSLYRYREGLENTYATVIHECVHLMQAILNEHEKTANFFERTGLPYPRREEYLSHKKEAEANLKLEYITNGLDPDIVNFHRLDDVEFYTYLLEEIISFIKEHINSLREQDSESVFATDIEKLIERHIDLSKFFKSMKVFRRDNYDIAVKEFSIAVFARFELIEKEYVSRIRSVKDLKRVQR